MVILCSGGGVVSAKREAPKEVLPITFHGVSYSAPHWRLDIGAKQNGGYIEATNLKTDKLLWKLKIYEIKYSGAESDVQDVFITSLKIAEGNLEILNEKGDKFVVDLTKRKVIKGANRVYRWREQL